MLIITALVKIAIFKDRDYNYILMNTASVVEPLSSIKISETTKFLSITRVRNKSFELVDSAIEDNALLMLSKKSFILSLN